LQILGRPTARHRHALIYVRRGMVRAIEVRKATMS
jgi:hypothetical protein